MSRAPLEVFGLSFLDVICCGLGAVLALFVFLASQLTNVADALPTSSDETASEADTFFSLSVVCRTSDTHFLLIAPTPQRSVRIASRTELGTSSRTFSASVFRDLPVADFEPLTIRVLAGRASTSLEALRQAALHFSGELSPGHQGLVVRLDEALNRLTTATSEHEWQEAVESAKAAVGSCQHREYSVPVDLALAQVDGSWAASAQTLREASTCDIEMTTSHRRRQLSRAVMGTRDLCISSRGGSYILDEECRK